MKAFWDNLFFDMRECGLTEEDFAEKAGKYIREDLSEITNSIKNFDLKKALLLLDEYSKEY